METFNRIMGLLMAVTLVSALFLGDHFVALSYRRRLAIAIVFTVIFGAWIVAANLVR